MAQKLAFKGTVNGIILQFDPMMPFDQLYDEITQKLNEANNFFKGSHIIGIEQGEFTLDQEQQLAHLFRSLGGMKVLSLEHVDRIKNEKSSAQPEPIDRVDEGSVLLPDMPAQPQEDVKRPLPKIDEHDKVIMHKGTIRSGIRLVSEGHIVLLGDANPGSELVAKGNILVLGSLRGTAHAGSDGDDGAYILANKLQPTQLRIGNHITRPPDGDAEGRKYTEIAIVKDKQFVIKPY